MFSELNKSDRIIGMCAAANDTREFEWFNTALGDISSWSSNLISSVNLILNSPVPMALWWGGQYIQIFNEAYKKSIGTLPNHPGLGENSLAFWSQYCPSFQNKVECSLEGKPSKIGLHLNTECPLQNTTWKFNLSPVYNEENAVAGILLVCQKESQTSSEMNEELGQVVDSSPYPLAIYSGPRMIIQYANQAIIDIYGKGNDVIGKSYFDLLPELKNQELFDQMREVYLTGKPFHAKYSKLDLVMNGKSQTFYFNYSFTPLYNSEGEIYGILNTGVDVTDLAKAKEQLEESEERFRVLAEALPIIIWSTDSQGKLNYMNQKGLDLIGETFDTMHDSNWLELFKDDNPEKVLSEIRNNVQSNKLLNREIKVAGKDGSVRWLLTQGTPSYYPNGELYGYVGSSLDITDRKRAEENLEKKNAQLVRINNDLDNFVYTASHDLKAPMSNIEGLLESLKDTLDAEIQQYSKETELILDMMKKSIDQFKDTIQDLTEITKTQKEPNADIENIHFEKVVRDVKVSLSGLLESAKAEIITDFEEVESIRFSKKNLKSIIYNLVGNAVKYRDRGRKPEVYLETKQTKDYTILSIKDNGLGIEKENYDRIFEMFKRLHAHEEGTGIGLYIVKRILDNVGGKIEVESEIGVGTEFKVYFKKV